MNEQRKDILDMLAEGKISAAEAEQLIAALAKDQPATVPSLDARSKGKAKYLRVVIETVEGDETGRINIRVPLQLLRAGVKLAALVPPQALDRANTELVKSGVPLDLKQLKPEDLEALVEHLDEVTVDLDQPDAKIRIFSE